MDSMICRGSVGWIVPAALALSALVAQAQPISEAEASSPATMLQYRSVFIQYQAFNPQPVTPWRETNDVVETIGGWRAYAKEARPPAEVEKTTIAPASVDSHHDHRSKP